MPVLLVTLHAYRSWSEGDARGYVQHGQGIKPTSDRLAKWREEHANQPPNRFEPTLHPLMHELCVEVTSAEGVTLHAASVTPTHLHLLLSFVDAECTCGASRRVDTRGSGEAAEFPPSAAARYHPKGCPVWQRGHRVAVRVKRIVGGRLSVHTRQPGRKWFSRGEDTSPVRNRGHYEHLITVYIPDHEQEGGTVQVYGDHGPAVGDQANPTELPDSTEPTEPAD